MLDILNQGLSIALSNFLSRLAFAIIGGLLLAFSLAGYGLGFLVWFALIPLFLLIKSSNTIKGCLLDSSLFLVTFHLASFIWLLALHPLTWQGLSTQESILVSVLAWIIPSISHSLMLLIFCLALKLLFIYRANERSYELNILDIVFLAFLWTVIQYKVIMGFGDNLRSFFVPINLIAYSQYQNLYLIQIANIIGSIGIEFFLVFSNLLLSNLFNVHRVYDQNKIYTSNLNVRKQFFGIEKTSDYISVTGVIFVLISGAYYYGYQNIKNYKNLRLSTPLKKIAILQADFSAKFTRSTEGFEKLIQLQANLSNTLQKRVDFLFWAEGAIPRTNYSGNSLSRDLEAVTKNFAFGTFITENGKTFNGLKHFSFEEKLSDKPVLKDLSELNQNSEETQEEIFILEPDFQLSSIYQAHSKIFEDNYKKNLLVPFGEYTPFYNQLPNNLKLLASHSIGSGFDASKEIKNIVTQYGNYAPSICFEILFPEHIRKFVNKDTDFIVNMNDLSWFKNPVKIFGIELGFLKGFVHRMMLSAATFRAIENNRDLVLVSNSGISTVIQATGARDKESKINTIKLIEDQLLMQKTMAFYTLYGF
jgi:apolipoprotein N-acyltransferase